METLQAVKAKSQHEISKLSLIISIILKKLTRNPIPNLRIKHQYQTIEEFTYIGMKGSIYCPHD